GTSWGNSDLSVTLQTSGGVVLIEAWVSHVHHGNAGDPRWWDIRVMRGSTAIVAGRCHAAANHDGSIHVTGVDTPPPGTHTYTVQWRGQTELDAGSDQLNNTRGLIAIELKP